MPIQYVAQLPYVNACQQACIAMLAGVAITEVIAVVGDIRLGVSEREKACNHFGIVRKESKIIIQTFAIRECGKTLTEIKQEYSGCPLWLSLYDCMDSTYGHAVLFYNDILYDPWHGVNPQWLWSRRLSDACPILSCPVL